MAYKFNGGRGAVICDKCRVMIDAGLSHWEYEDVYVNNGRSGDLCWKCFAEEKKEKEKKEKNASTSKKAKRKRSSSKVRTSRGRRG